MNSIDLYEQYSKEGGDKPRRRRLVESLTTRLGNDVLVLSATGVANIVVFRDKAQSLLKLVNDNDDSDINVSIKKLAGKIVKEIKTIDCDKTQYTTRLHRETIKDSVSDTLMRFLSKLSSKPNRTPQAYLFGKIVTNALINYPTPLHIALGVLMKNYKNLVSIMNEGVSCSYDELLRLNKSAAVAAATLPALQGISDSDSGLFQVVVDNS